MGGSIVGGSAVYMYNVHAQAANKTTLGGHKHTASYQSFLP